jgi:peptidoglycan/xylan/chitin deacetylase (PgdA/CDA1 family)
MRILDFARTLKWTILRSAIAAAPLSMIRRAVQGRLVCFYYHVVADELKPHLSQLYANVHTVKTFGEELEFIRKWFNPITAAQLISHIQNKEPLPENPCLITFDDGYREVYENAFPEFRKRDIPFVFFLTLDFIGNKSLFVENTVSLILDRCSQDSGKEQAVKRLLAEHGVSMSESFRPYLQRIPYRQRPLVEKVAKICDIDSNEYAAENRPYVDAAEVREMLASGLVEVGAHSVDHARNEDLSASEQYGQVADSLDSIVQLFDLPMRLYAFPYSDRSISSETYRRLFDDLRVDLAFGTNELRSSANPRVVQRCWMDTCHSGGPKSKVSKLFQAEVLCTLKERSFAGRG